MAAQLLRQLRVQTLARRVGNHNLELGGGQAVSARLAWDERDLGPLRRAELRQPQLEPVQRTWTEFIHCDFADLLQNRQPDGAHTGIEFSNPRTEWDLLAHVLDDEFRDI